MVSKCRDVDACWRRGGHRGPRAPARTHRGRRSQSYRARLSGRRRPGATARRAARRPAGASPRARCRFVSARCAGRAATRKSGRRRRARRTVRTAAGIRARRASRPVAPGRRPLRRARAAPHPPVSASTVISELYLRAAKAELVASRRGRPYGRPLRRDRPGDLRGVYHHRTLRRHEGHCVCRRLPGGLHPSAEGRARLRIGATALHPSRRMHRLRRLRSGLSRGGDLRARRDSGKVEDLHRRQRAALSEIEADLPAFAYCFGGQAGRPGFPGPGGSAPMMRWTLRFVLCAPAIVAGTLVLQADDKITAGDAELQFQLGNLLSEQTRFREALDAYEKAIQTDDRDLQVRARQGKVKTALRIAEYDLAQKEGELLRASAPSDSEALSLYADSLWSVGLFDEADDVYEQALAINKESSRARFGRARSLATRTKLEEALTEAQAAAAMAPRDGEIYAEIGAIYQRLHRFDEAANAYNNFINLLPNKDRSDKAAWTRSQVKFLKAFEGRNPVEIDQEDLDTTHTMPFRLVDDKIVVQAKG